MADEKNDTKNEEPQNRAPIEFSKGDKFELNGVEFEVEKVGSRGLKLRALGKVKLISKNRFMEGMLKAREKDRKAAAKKAKAAEKKAAEDADKTAEADQAEADRIAKNKQRIAKEQEENSKGKAA